MPWDPILTPVRGLVLPVRVDPAGVHGPTPNQARGSRWRVVARGLHVPADVDAARPEQRVAEAAAQLPAGGAVTGWGALRLAGAAFFDGSPAAPVDLVAGRGQSRRARPGVRWHQDRLPGEQVWLRYGVPCTVPARALFDAMRTADDDRTAVLAMGMAAAADLVSVRRMHAFVEHHPGWAGVPRVRRALSLADECSRSPGESRLRLRWVLDAHRPVPLTNRDVFDAHGRLLGVADLIDPVTGVVGEYDGADHARARRRSQDARRDGLFRDHGLEVFRITGYDEHHPREVVARVQAAYRRAGARPRTWTLIPPPGWPVAPTLDDLLDAADAMRALHGAPISSDPWSGGPATTRRY